MNDSLRLIHSSKFIKKILFQIHKKRISYIRCKDCDATYVGKRQLKTRLTKHRNYIHKNTFTYLVITDCRLHYNHEFDWNNVAILDSEYNYKKRLISEMIHKKKTTEEWYKSSQ